MPVTAFGSAGLRASLDAAPPAVVVDPYVVNRAGKGDRLAVAVKKGLALIPSAGTVWTLSDIFADYGDDLLPKVAFAVETAESVNAVDMAAVAASKEISAEPPQELASVAPLPRPRGTVPSYPRAGKTGSGVVLAYAPAGEEIEAPFDALLGNTAPADTHTASTAPGTDAPVGAGLPQAAAPATSKHRSFFSWLTGRGDAAAVQPGAHSWASDPLPDSVYLAKEQDCLARGIYFEARGESELGQTAVAQVILNRVKNPAYPDTICGVVYQNKSWRGRCQFSFACDGHADRIREPGPWARAQRIAHDVTQGNLWVAEVGDSTHYHANYVRPRWARRMTKMDKIGAHIFYRTKNGGWG